jgi:diaminopimelate decarboxylase
VAALFACARRIEHALAIQMEFVNIGGGIGIPYRPGQAAASLDDVAAIVAACYDEAGFAGAPALFMENGRFLTGPHGWLLSTCEAMKAYPANEATSTADSESTFFGLDASMANLMRPGMYGAYHHVYVPARETFEQSVLAAAAASDLQLAQAKEQSNRKELACVDQSGVAHSYRLANVVGTLCENNDWFAKDRPVPACARVGDVFVLCDTGAHSHSMGFQYNGKTRAPEVMLIPGSDAGHTRVELIRQRESIHSLFDGTILPNGACASAPTRFAYPYSGRIHAVGTRGNTVAARAELTKFSVSPAVHQQGRNVYAFPRIQFFENADAMFSDSFIKRQPALVAAAVAAVAFVLGAAVATFKSKNR